MRKSLTSKLHLKHRLYSHHLVEGMSLKDYLNIFKDIVTNLETVEVKYDEDLELILLCLLPPYYSNLKDSILYSCETLTLDEVYDVLFSNDKMKHLVVRSKAQGEGLIVQGRTHKNEFWWCYRRQHLQLLPEKRACHM